MYATIDRQAQTWFVKVVAQFTVAIPEDWHVWKKQLILRIGLCYEWPTHIKQCPLLIAKIN